MRAAHALKGCAGNVSAEAVREAALELERLGGAKNLEAAARQLESLKAEVDRCVSFIRRSEENAGSGRANSNMAGK